MSEPCDAGNVFGRRVRLAEIGDQNLDVLGASAATAES